jgi:serine/threonine protein kinase
VLRVGETIGHYEILAKLKAGGMATLFVGKKTGASGFSRHVAIKVVHEHLASDADFVRMFVDEALLQAQMHHPNIVHVEELGQADGSHFLVMEYVHGCSLAQLLDGLARRDRRLAPEIAVHIAIQTLAGLHAAHELKDGDGTPLAVVHRDVSPQNVLLAYEGHVKLIDFGVAKARNRSQQTTGASLKGKLRYMPPEQAFGGEIDRRADVYALGIVLWEMLAFRKLFFAKDDLLLLDLVRSPKVKPPSTYTKGIPAALDAVVMKALAPKVENRYATAQDFRRALAEAMPKAMLVDAANVADLLVAIMGDQMAKDREVLPSQLSKVVQNDQRRQQVDTGQVEEVLHTMTISAAGLAYLSEIAIDVDEPAPAPALPKTRELPAMSGVPRTREFAGPVLEAPGGSSTIEISPDLESDPRRPRPAHLETTGELLAPTHHAPSPSATPLPTPIMAIPQAPPSRLPWIAAIVAVLAVIAVGAAYVGLSTPPEPVATALPPSPVVAPATATPTSVAVEGVPSTPIEPTPAVVAPVAEPSVEIAPAVVEPVRPTHPTSEPSTSEPPRPRPPRTGRPARPPRGSHDVPLADEW